jgi:hypothetical protein
VADVFVSNGVENLVLQSNGDALVANKFGLLLVEEVDGFGCHEGQCLCFLGYDMESTN